MPASLVWPPVFLLVAVSPHRMSQQFLPFTLAAVINDPDAHLPHPDCTLSHLCPSHSYTCILSYFYWLSCLFSPEQISLFQLLHTLTTHHDVLCKRHSAWRLLPDLLCQPVLYCCKQVGIRADPWCYPSNPSVSPTAHLTPVSLSSHMSSQMSCTGLTYFSAAPDFNTTPQFLS